MIKNIDKSACVECRLCEYYCPEDVFRYEDGVVNVVYARDCCNCWQCSRICPVDAIRKGVNLIPDTYPKKFNGGYRWEKVKQMCLEGDY